MFKLDRRTALTAGVLTVAGLGLGACNGGGSGGAASVEGEMSQGAADAPVTVVEFASITCPHCSAWSRDVGPAFKARYVDTGLVRFVFRELPTAPAPTAIAGFLTARCAGEEQYFPMIEAMMRNQPALYANPRQALLDIARTAGMSEAEFDACVRDEGALDAMQRRIDEANQRGVPGTPAFYVNDELIGSGEVPLEDLAAAIDPLLGDRAPAPLAEG
jgi:protein-disulfide isomerase